MLPDPPYSDLPLVAILRGVTVSRVVEIAHVLYDAGWRVIEVPLNSPDPFASIAALAARRFPGLLVGAGTVLTLEEVRRTHEAGGSLVVSPNCNPEVIRLTLALGMRSMPGIATATEIFSAIDAGARELKLFPAVTYGPAHLRSLTAVLPAGVGVLPVGGLSVASIPDWLSAGASGFGFGSDIFRPAYTIAEIARRAQELVKAYRSGLAEIEHP